ncbi:hypothetical protein AKJ16_DCAP24487 [Drosera capensis]
MITHFILPHMILTLIQHKFCATLTRHFQRDINFPSLIAARHLFAKRWSATRLVSQGNPQTASESSLVSVALSNRIFYVNTYIS